MKEPNYNITEVDLQSTLLFNHPSVKDIPNLTTVMLYLMGMDTKRKIEKLSLDDNVEVVGAITPLLQKGGNIYVGYERTDSCWKKGGKERMIKWLYEDCSDLVDVILKGGV